MFSIGQNSSDTLVAGDLLGRRVAGGTPTQLVSSPDGATDSCPQLSPDGTQLAFVRDSVAADGNETVTLELDAGRRRRGDGARRLARPDARGRPALSFSPDGKTIAYAGDASRTPGIFAVPVAGRPAAQLTLGLGLLAVFSPDGSTLFFSRDAFSPNADDNADIAGRPGRTTTSTSSGR